MNLMIELDWNQSDAIKKLDLPAWANLRERVPQLQMSEWKEGEKQPYFYGSGPYLIDVTTHGQALTEAGITYTVKSFKNTYKVADPESHQHIHIHIPNVGLLEMDEVTWEEDACTERLQEQLNAGWRMIAVCPPNGTRRPTYILGRSRRVGDANR